MSDHYSKILLKISESIILLFEEYSNTLKCINLTKRNIFLLKKVFVNYLDFEPIANNVDVGNYLYNNMHDKFKVEFPNDFQRLMREFIFLKNLDLIGDLNRCLDIKIKINRLSNMTRISFIAENTSDFLDHIDENTSDFLDNIIKKFRFYIIK